MTGLQRALTLSVVGVVLLVALGTTLTRNCGQPFVRGVAAGIMWGALVPLLEATIRGGWLVARPVYGYLFVLLLPPVMSVVVFLALPAYARAFALASFSVWLLSTSVLDLCCRKGREQ
jgi:hypothetical protein